MTQKVLVFEPQKCIGCRLCEQWCSFSHYEVTNPAKSCIHIIRLNKTQKDTATYCHQCSKAACIEACKFDALTRDKETGAILVDEEKCTGCRMCIHECPYAAPVMHPEKKLVLICDLCGGHPECVAHCPENAIQYLEVGKAANIYRTIYSEKMAAAMVEGYGGESNE